MEWDRSTVIGLAMANCMHCYGYGMRLVHRGKPAPCNCVLREIFRECYHRFRECAALSAHTGTVSLEFCRGVEGRRSYSRKREEFSADFCLVSRRVLNDFEYQIFRYHFLLGASWKLCCRRLQMDRGNFFHALYRIEERLGRVFAELQPYPLYPLEEYFGGVIHDDASPCRNPVVGTAGKAPVLPLSA